MYPDPMNPFMTSRHLPAFWLRMGLGRLDRRFLNGIALLLTVFLPVGLLSASDQGRGNVLLIMVDDLRPETRAYGAEHMHTPHMDRLAGESMVFTRAHAQVPACGPSRASMLTGLRLTLSAFNVNAEEVERPFTSLPRHFRDAGYHAVSLGKVFHNMPDCAEDWSEPPWRSQEIYHGEHDWARYNSYGLWRDPASGAHVNPANGRGPYYEAAEADESGYQDAILAERAVECLKGLAKREEPFFLAVGFWRPHLPFIAPKSDWDLYEHASLTLAKVRERPPGFPGMLMNSLEIPQYGRTDGWPAGESFHRTARQGYYACVSHVDRQIGRLLTALDELGLEDSTTLVLVGDHGFCLGGKNFWAKANLLSESTRSALMIKAPGLEARPRMIPEVVELLDIYPTLCDLLDLPKPAHLDGKSLEPLMSGRSEVWDYPAYATYEGGRNIITEDHAYTEWPLTGARLLFDLRKDPDENRNVVEEPAYRPVVRRMQAQLERVFPTLNPEPSSNLPNP